jgi:hypothetical protein
MARNSVARKQSDAIPSVFISYARSDPGDFLELVRSFLADQGFEIWLDVRTMPNRGRTFLDEIRRAIEDADRVVVVLGPAAAASKYVEAEWRHALLVGKPIHVVCRDLPRDQVPEPLRRFDIREFSAHNVPVQLDRLATQLKAAPAPIGPFLSPIAPLPTRYVPRPDVEARIQWFLRELADDVGPNSERVMIVAGMPGVGKTAIVTACISDYAIRRLFSDGIAVVNCAELDDPRSIEANILATIGPHIHSGRDDSPLRDLRATLAGRRVLIVLENLGDATALGEIAWLSPGVRVIVSSRNQRMGPQLGYAQLVVSCPDETTGVAILEGWAGRSVRSAVDLASRLGLHPLALRIAGSMIASGLTEDAVTEFQSHPGTLVIDPELGLDFGALMAAAAGSLEAGSHQLLALLGLYTIDADVPLYIVRRAADSLGSSGEYDAALDQLADRGLIDIDWSAQRLRVHRLVHYWCRDLLEHERGTANAHRSFVQTYANDVDQLAEIHDDGYIFDHLVYHLIQGQLVDAAISLVTSEGWADKRLITNNYNSQVVLRDLSRVCDVCIDELRHSPGAEETKHRSRSLGVLSWRVCEVVARIEPKGVAVVRALVDSGLWNTARALHYGQQAIDNIEACNAVSALLDGGSLLSDQDNRVARSILLDRLDRAMDEGDFVGRFIPCLLAARRHLEDSSIDALVDIVRRAGMPFQESLAAIYLLPSFPHDERIRSLVMNGVGDSQMESNERATLIAAAADHIEDTPSLERLYEEANNLDERTRPWAVIGLALAHPEYWHREDRADLHRAANQNYLPELSRAFGDKMDRDLAEFILASERLDVTVDFLTATILYPHLTAASQATWRAGLLGRARFEIGRAAEFWMLDWEIERYADVLVRYAAMAPSLDDEDLGELLSIADLMPPSESSAALLLSLLEYCDDEAALSAVDQRLNRILAELDDGTDLKVRCVAFSRGLRDVSGPEDVLLGQISAVSDPSIRNRCINLVCPHVSRAGLRILAGRSVTPAEQVWIHVIARSDPTTMMAALREWDGADSNDAAWPQTLRLLLGMNNLATEDRNWAEAALLRSCAEPQLEEEPAELERSIVARAYNEYKWILDFSDSFPVLGPEAMSASLPFLEKKVSGSPSALSKHSPEEVFTTFSQVIRWLYVATCLERRRRAGEPSVPEAYYLAPALRYALPALSERTGGPERRRAVAFEASATEAVEHILGWCDRWHGYGEAPAFVGDVGRRPIDRYYGLAVLVELLPHVSAVMRRRIFGCVEAEIHWILPVHALTLLGALIENAEPDEIDRVTAVAGLDREDPHWIRALLFARAGFPAGAQRCDLGIAVLRYAVGLAFQGPSACLLGSAELSAHTDDIASHVQFDIASLLAGVVDSARGSTTRSPLE